MALYLLDGGPHFHHVTGIVDFLAGIYRIPPMIVVGVTNTDRIRDMTPPTDRTTMTLAPPFGGTGDSLRIPMPTAGGADDFLRFLTDELGPHIEAEYRTAPFRVLVGHSFAGLFAVHAFLTRPESFRAYLAISPSLMWDDRALLRRARGALPGLPLDGRFLYMTAGDQEMGDMLGGGGPPGRGVPRARLRDPRPRGRPQTMGYMQLQFGRPERAVEIFRRAVRLYPSSANVYDSLADGLEAAGRLDEALENREVAVRRAEEIGDPRLETFRDKRDALEGRLAEN